MKARSLEVFEGMGLADTFVRRGQIVRAVALFLEGAKVASVGFEGVDSPFPFMLSIPEHETEAILTERLAEFGGEIERGVEFIGLEQGEDSVRARLHAAHNADRMLEASWVVGTDGVHSAVRDAIGDGYDGHDNPSRFGVVDVHLSGWSHPSDSAAFLLDPPGMNPLPLRDGRWRIYFRPEPNVEDVLANVGERLAAISPDVALRNPDEPQLFYTHARVARRYRIGRVLLAGDAAHACSPIEGHGMNVGIQDAYNLGWKLALVASGAAPESLLDSYEAERRPVAQAVAQSGDEAEARFLPESAAARQVLVETLATAEGVQGAAVAESEIAIGYGQSPIVDEIPTIRPLAEPAAQIGSRIGDAGPLEGQDRTVRLHELIAAAGHTLLLMLGEADQVSVDNGLALARAAALRYEPHVQAFVVTTNAATEKKSPNERLRDLTGALHDRLAGDRPALCLVRPDGHLGFRSEPPSIEALDAHLGRVFLLR